MIPLDVPSRLAVLSRRLGADPWLTQGASGNTAVKTSADRMLIKATRTRLIDMTERTGWAVLDPAALREDIESPRMRAAAPGDYLAALDAAQRSPGPRVSLESGLHVQLPAPWTAHVHSLAGQILGMRSEDDIRRRTAFLAGVAVRIIPAVPPGGGLAAAVCSALRDNPLLDEPCLLILRHHGLVWGGPSPESIETLSGAFEEKLRGAFGLADFPPPPMESITALGDGWYRVPFHRWPRAGLGESPAFFEFTEHFRIGENLRRVSPTEAEVRAKTRPELETHRDVLFAQALLGTLGTEDF